MRYAVALLTLLVLVVPASAQTTVTLDDAIRGIEGAYGRMTDLKAEFTQTAFNKSLNQTIPATGKVYLKKGGKLRWEYAEPTPQQIVSDGKTIWIYTPTLNQVNTGPAPEALAGPAGSFLSGLGKLREHFSVRLLNPAQPKDADGNVVLDLAAAPDSRVRSQWLAAAEGRRLRPVREHGHHAVHQPRDQLRPGGQALRVRPAERHGDRSAEVVRRRASCLRPPARPRPRARVARPACAR